MNYPNWAGHIIYLEKRHQVAVMASLTLLALILFTSQAVTLIKLLRSNPLPTTMQTNMPTHPKPIPKVIASVPLFGNPIMAADEAANKNLPATNLQLTLRGVVAESEESKSSAVIEEPGKPALPYNVGDTLPGNAVLNSVFSDHVVLKRNGQLETLNFPIQNKLNIKSNEDTRGNEFGNESKVAAQIPDPDPAQQPVPGGNISPHSIQERLQQLQQQQQQQQQYKPH